MTQSGHKLFGPNVTIPTFSLIGCIIICAIVSQIEEKRGTVIEVAFTVLFVF